MFDRIRSFFAKRAPETDPRALFRAEVEAIVRSVEGIVAVTPAAEVFALDLTTSSGALHRMFLENHFLETREMAPEERRARIVASISGIDERRDLSWAEARENLLPVIRGATFGALPPSARAPGMNADASPLRRSFVPFVDVLAVVDGPSNMLYVTDTSAEQWGVTADEIFDTALGAFAERASLDSKLYDDKDGPLFVVATNDSYESSRLLVPGWLASFRGKVEGDPIAIVPHRELLFVGGSARPEMVARLVDMAEREFSASSRNISPALYTVDAEGHVVPYLGTDPAVRVAHEKLAIYEYGEQSHLLEETEPDFFVAKYSVYQLPDGGVRSTAAWTEGVDTLLPKTAWVSLVKLDEAAAADSVVAVPWDAIADRLTQMPGMHPPRFRTGAFPDAKELAALKARYAE